jgi:hypothetical protein
MKNTFPNFSGKLVSLSMTGDSHTYTMERARFESQGGRVFLVGIVPRGGSRGDWSEGAGCAIAWDVVTDYLVFDSVEHYQKRLAKFAKYKKKHKRNA